MRKIRLTESGLRRLIAESVRRILNEDEMPTQGKHVVIYQLDPHNEESHGRLFQSLERLERYGLDFDPSLYRVVYDGELPVDTVDEVYSYLQWKHPEGYNGHSLSVSDLVEIDGRVLFCDSKGWQDVTDMFG